MKTILLLILAIGAFSAQKPVITLDTTNLVEAAGRRYSSHQSGTAAQLAQHVQKADYVFECVFDASSCDAPVATAHDHHNNNVAVQDTYFLIEKVNGVTKETQRKPNGYQPFQKVLLGAQYVHKTQIIKYDATDAAGNKAEQLVVAFFIYDNEAPLITVCGPSPETFQAIYAAYKQTATTTPYRSMPVPYLGCHNNDDVAVADLVDSNIPYTRSITLAGVEKPSIDLSVVGTFTISYTATDLSGNTGAASKTVVIQDTLAPKITRSGSASMNHECHTTYTDAGASCTDLRDGPISVSTDMGGLDENKNGAQPTTYTVTYTCVDEIGNTAAPVKRMVTIRDTTNPVIALNGKADIQLWAGELVWSAYGKDYNKGNHKNVAHEWTQNNKNDEWVTCSDTCDSTPSITNDFSPAFTPKVPGLYTETYTCKDLQGNTVTVDRRITIVDAHQPVMKLHGQDPLTIEAAPGYQYQDQGAACTDEVDGNLSKKVVVSGKVVNGAEPGTYQIDYNCADAKGNKGQTLHRQVIVQDTTIPTIYITSSKYMVIEASFPFADPGATAFDSLDGDLTSRITSEQLQNGKAAKIDPFNTDVKQMTGAKQVTGLYTIEYNVKDDENNAAAQEVRTVVVKDTLPPVIVVNHADSGNLGSGSEKYDVHPFGDETYGKGYEATAKGRNSNNYIALAEESTAAGVNGWVIGAVASAVTGLALLGYAGYSMKKTGYTAVTSVPV